jgi:acyl carrier protein
MVLTRQRKCIILGFAISGESEMNEMDDLLEILTGLFPDVDFETEDRLVDDKILDSYDLDSIVSEIEDQFGVTIPAELVTAENFNSADDMYDLIQKLDE